MCGEAEDEETTLFVLEIGIDIDIDSIARV
jgi:hypothetical protein